MTTRYIHHLPEQMIPSLAALCEDAADTMEAIASCKPSMSLDEQCRIDAFFGVHPPHEISIVTEQINKALAEQVSASLRGVGALLKTPLVTPSVIAPPALASVEASSVLKFLSHFKGTERAIWSVRSITERVNETTQLSLIEEIPGILSEAEAAWTKHLGTDLPDFPSDETLVNEMMEDLLSENFHSRQRNYSTQHAWSGFKHMIYREDAAEMLEISTIETAFDTLSAASSAALFLADFRDIEVYEHLEKLRNLTEQGWKIYQEWAFWMVEHERAPLR